MAFFSWVRTSNQAANTHCVNTNSDVLHKAQVKDVVMWLNNQRQKLSESGAENGSRLASALKKVGKAVHSLAVVLMGCPMCFDT